MRLGEQACIDSSRENRNEVEGEGEVKQTGTAMGRDRNTRETGMD